MFYIPGRNQFDILMGYSEQKPEILQQDGRNVIASKQVAL